MDHCDVLIIGGGPAGSTCAWKLVRAGLDVVVLDRKAFPRDKICAGWVTPAVLEELRIDEGEYRRDGRTMQAITAFRTGIIGGREVETRYRAAVSYGIRRSEFDHFLLARSGARIATPEAVRTLVRDARGWIANDALAGRVLVGAGGHFCPVARHLGAQLGRSETVVAAQEIEFPMTDAQAADCEAEGEMPELYFCDDLKGYGWVFRKGAHLNVGLGREDNHRLAEHVQSFARWLKSKRRVPQDMPEKFAGHAYLLYNHAPRPLVGDHALLVGDAAGLAYPQSGEGIRPAVESSLLAAEALIAAGGTYTASNLAAYEGAMLARFGPRQTESFTDRLPEGMKRFLATRMLGNRWFTRHMVIDEWFLHAKQAALAS
jgi:geranylgeranyl reductase family protein